MKYLEARLMDNGFNYVTVSVMKSTAGFWERVIGYPVSKKFTGQLGAMLDADRNAVMLTDAMASKELSRKRRTDSPVRPARRLPPARCPRLPVREPVSWRSQSRGVACAARCAASDSAASLMAAGADWMPETDAETMALPLP